ncbi:MAG: sirohydrochlorin chelatase [Myxococcota bacterium]
MRRAIILVDHGSKRPEANDIVRQVAALVQRALPDMHVCHAHMELASPSIGEAFDACVSRGAEEVVIHPYFLAPGNHGASDIPRLALAAAARHTGVRARVSEPLGVHEKIGEVIIERVASARLLDADD